MKNLLFIGLLTLTSFAALSQYSPIYISGSVKEANGNPIAKQHITILSDTSGGGWGYFNNVYTDSNGLYNLTITPPAGIIRQFKATTYDCHQHRIDSFFTNTTQNITLNFMICYKPPPTCNAYFRTDSLNNPYIRHFIDQSYGTPTSYNLDFGDGTFSTLKNPAHTFAKGDFNVCLSIYDSVTNCSSTDCRWVYIDNHCFVGFIYDDSNLTVKFFGYNNTALTKSVSYSWEFGDGATSTLQNPVHTYSSLSSFNVCMTANVIDSQNYSCSPRPCTQIQLGLIHKVPIEGRIHSSTYTVDKALVYLIKYNPNDSTLTAIDSVFSMDSSGMCSYYFNNVLIGDYLIKAALTSASISYSHLLPTYYGNVLYWDQATTIRIKNQTGYIRGADIIMVSGNNPGGPGFIGGKTSKGANIWELNPELPIGNVEILLLDQSGNPVSYNYSKASGDFGFNSLALGTYQIYAELPGKKTSPAYVTIDAQNPSVNDVKIVITKKSIGTSVNPDISISMSNVGNIYPNPIQGKLNLDIYVKKTVVVVVQITNNLGQVIKTTHYKLTTGRNTITSDTHNLPQGIYTLNIKASDGANVFKNFVLIK